MAQLKRAFGVLVPEHLVKKTRVMYNPTELPIDIQTD